MSSLLDPLFGDPAVDALFSPAASIEAMLQVEVALAETSAALGLVPEALGPALRAVATVDRIDLAALGEDAVRAGNLAIPLVTQLRGRLGAVRPELAGFVHWGATSQDVLDTALALQLSTAGAIVVDRTRRTAARAFELADRHAATPMAARTWLQHATPTSFGLVMAGFGDALRRSGDRLARAIEAAAVVELGGAAGTRAAFGGRGAELAQALGGALGLAVPSLPWHTHRDRLAEVAAGLGILAGLHGKLGRDVGLASQAEVAELAEGSPGGSSAMPQKENPVRSAVAIAAATRAPGLVATLLAALPQEQQRGLGSWPAEWSVLPDLVRLVAGSARAVEELLADLVVHPARMRANLDASRGLIYAEALLIALAPSLGPDSARALVQRLVDASRTSGRSLREVTAADPTAAERLAGALDRIFDPGRQLGEAAAMIARARTDA